MPDHAVVLLALTATDLWPGGLDWNLGFGDASLKGRIGVSSIQKVVASLSDDPGIALLLDSKSVAVTLRLFLAAESSGEL